MKIINQMSENYNQLDRTMYKMYRDHKNINPSERDICKELIGNYHDTADKYNPIKLLTKFPYENDIKVFNEEVLFSHTEINSFLYNHIQTRFGHQDSENLDRVSPLMFYIKNQDSSEDSQNEERAKKKKHNLRGKKTLNSKLFRRATQIFLRGVFTSFI